MPISTTLTQILSVTPAERDRVDAELNTLSARTAALQSNLDTANAMIAQLNARIAALVAELATRPPAPPPVVPPVVVPPVVPPATARTGLYVDGRTLRTKTGAPVVIRGIELMWGPTASSNPGRVLDGIRSFGANAIGPLFQQGSSGAPTVVACISAARARGMVVGVNADHTGEGRTWLCRPDIVAACNVADNVFLQCEVEQGTDDSLDSWKSGAIAFVAALRAAGHRAPIKVGSPAGGRLPMFALEAGAAVLASDPLRSVLFTWQAYWKTSTAGWQYAWEGDFAAGTVGALQCADAIVASGLCFLVGLDGADDVGATPYAELAARLHAGGVGWQWWAWMVGDQYGNGLVSETMSTTPKAPFGSAVRALLTTQSVLSVLG
jgi:hypothetical protein